MPRELEEGYRKIASILAASAREKGSCSSLMAAARRGEGTTTITLAVARELKARYGLRAMAIELDFRRPRYLKRFRLSPERSLYNLAEGYIEPAEAIQYDRDGVALVAAGERGQQPSRDLAPVMRRLIDEAASVADVILVDLPPLLEHASILSVASVVPNLVLIVEAGRTSTEVLNQVKAELSHWNVVLVGSILNKRRRFMPAWLERALR